MPTCNARKKTCSECGHRYTKDEHDLWECPECGADRHCQQRVKREGLRCRMHGGATPAGIANANFKHGRYSKVLPTSLAERYEASLSDQEILALRDEIALLDTRLGDLVASIRIGATSDLWNDLSTAFQELQTALATKDPDGANIAMVDLREAIAHGRDEQKTWTEVYTLLEQRRKLVESERKRLVEMHQILTVEQAMVLLARVQEAIINNVSDRTALAGISAELKQLVDFAPRS